MSAPFASTGATKRGEIVVRALEHVWDAQEGPQAWLMDCPAYEIFFGGARGGGKTDGALGRIAYDVGKYGGGVNALFLRRELPMLDDAIERSKAIFGPLGAKYHTQSKTWRFPNGARVRFRPLDSIDFADKYQGQNITHIVIEEAGQFPDPAPIMKLHGVLRSVGGVPTLMLLTGNPGGPGHLWLRERYVTPDPYGRSFVATDFEDPFSGKTVRRYRCFIPSKLKDNRKLLDADPMYVANLYMVGSEALVKAWLEGDWNAIEGAFFDKWRSKIILPSCDLPQHWTRFRSMDWGFATPYSVGWWAVASEDWKHPINGQLIPRGSLVRYREMYGIKKTRTQQGTVHYHANVGTREDAMEVADKIVNAELVGNGTKRYEEMDISVCDPSAFNQTGTGPSIAERMFLRHDRLLWKKADNSRVPKGGHVSGWDEMRYRIRGNNDGRPLIYCFDTCIHSIRTIPTLQHDPMKPEDLDTESEDHAADDWRYACMSRPIIAKTPEPPKPLEEQGLQHMTLDEMWESERRWKLQTFDERIA